MKNEELFATIAHNQAVRKNITAQSHYWFFHVYLSRYITYETAPFHREMLQLTEADEQMLLFMAFRGSGKSTILSLSYPLWALLGYKRKRFVLILSQTQHQAHLLLQHIKTELEENELVKKDFGPFVSKSTQWSSDTIVIPRFNAKIMAASSEQSVRGIRHEEVRPDLIICDDIEDLGSVKTMESRTKTFRWLMGEIIPAGDRDTQLVILGNLLHEDSLLMRLEELIDEEEIDGIVRRYPIVEHGKPIWPGKFPDEAAITKERRKIGNPIAWNREYELKIVPDEGQIITYENIKYYDELPALFEPEEDRWHEDLHRMVRIERLCTGIDLAISKRESADYTAMVSVQAMSFQRKEMKFFILPNPINKRLDFGQTIQAAKDLSITLGNNYHYTELFVEQVGYQLSAIQQMETEGLPAKGVTVAGSDKRARLNIVAPLIKSGKIVFPKKGCEELIAQIVGFGVEKHDDLVDAFTLVMMQVMNHTPQLHITDMPSRHNDDYEDIIYTKSNPFGHYKTGPNKWRRL